MFTQLLRLYTLALEGQVHTPVPHLFGPPGCGKSTVVAQLAEILGVNLHTINVSRISPLELEGVQMPIGMETEDPKLHLLTATYWKQLQDGDILLLDEFLRGFPEVYNGLLDILTSREVAGFKLPNVFIVAASNSVVTYDPALEDRLLHLPVPDIRYDKAAMAVQMQRFIDMTGMHPSVKDSYTLEELFEKEVLPTYSILDQLGGRSNQAVNQSGKSIRNLIGQVQLREIQSTYLRTLIEDNNRLAISHKHHQYLIVTDATQMMLAYPEAREQLQLLYDSGKLKGLQARNVKIALQLFELRDASLEGEERE